MEWVTSEVLPSIRKTGSYNFAAPPPAPATVHHHQLTSRSAVRRCPAPADPTDNPLQLHEFEHPDGFILRVGKDYTTGYIWVSLEDIGNILGYVKAEEIFKYPTLEAKTKIIDEQEVVCARSWAVDGFLSWSRRGDKNKLRYWFENEVLPYFGETRYIPFAENMRQEKQVNTFGAMLTEMKNAHTAVLLAVESCHVAEKRKDEATRRLENLMNSFSSMGPALLPSETPNDY